MFMGLIRERYDRTITLTLNTFLIIDLKNSMTPIHYLVNYPCQNGFQLYKILLYSLYQLISHLRPIIINAFKARWFWHIDAKQESYSGKIMKFSMIILSYISRMPAHGFVNYIVR